MIIFAVILFVCILLPFWQLYRAVADRLGSKTEVIVNAVSNLSLAGFLVLIIPWGGASIHLRWAAFILLVGAAIITTRNFASTLSLWPATRKRWIWSTGHLLTSVFFLWLLFGGLTGLSAPSSAIELEFPLQSGSYLIGQGGDSRYINQHWPYRQQKFALDILKINKLGLRAKTLLPKTNSDFEIYGDTVHAPCTGRIKKVVTGHQDIGYFDREALKKVKPKDVGGNEILLECEKADIVLAHLMPGSILVKEGQAVEVLQKLARAGNTGNTTEPHLHIQAQTKSDDPSLSNKSIKPIPMKFEGRFLIRNSVIKVKSTGI